MFGIDPDAWEVMSPEEKHTILKTHKTTTKSAQAHLICIPGNAPYRIRNDTLSGDVIKYPMNAHSIAETDALTVAASIEENFQFPYDHASMYNKYKNIDIIRNEFFSFFDDIRTTGGGSTHIDLRKQFGDSSWTKEDVPPTLFIPSGPGQTLQSEWTLGGNSVTGRFKYFYPKIDLAQPPGWSLTGWTQQIELDLPIGWENDPPFPLIPGSRAGYGGAIAHAAAGSMNMKSPFLDTTFILNKPFVEVAYKEALGEKLGISNPVRVQAHYNFYLVPYESITKDEATIPIGLEDQLLPNLYGIVVDAKNENKENYVFKHADNWQYHHEDLAAWAASAVDAGGAAKIKAKAKWGSFAQHTKDANSHGESGFIDTHNEYLNKFAMKLKEGAAKSWPSFTFALEDKKYKTTGLSAYQLKDFMDEADRIKKFFPMYADLNIPASNGGKFGEILYEAGVFDQFMQLMMAAIYPNNRPEDMAPKLGAAIVKRDSSIYDNPKTPDKIDLSVQKDSLYYEPLITLWLNKLLSRTSIPALASFFLTTNASKVQFAELNANFTPPTTTLIPPVVFGKESQPTSWISDIKWALNKNKIDKFIIEKTRSVSDIYDGKYAHSEVLFYEIVKFHRAPNASDTFIQNIFLPNIPGVDMLKYVDTQVRFGQEYYYQIYAHTLVIGTEYKLSTDAPVTATALTDGHQYKFNYNFTPAVHLMRVPYYNTYVTMQGAVSAGSVYDKNKLEATPIWDKPPVFPDIVFHPLHGEKNKILINSNFNVGEYDLEPFVIDKEEVPNLDKIRRNQKKLDGPITFRGDDFCGHIEVLRINRKPLLYSDFGDTKNTKIAILGGTSNFGEILEQEPNKEYYYMARAIDKHGNYSNPSPIYQVVIIAREGEAPYAIINMFFIEEAEEKKPIKRKNLMKYIRIQPSFDQSFLDNNTVTNIYDTAADFGTSGELEKYLGNTVDHTVFGENFKFRFTSKKTGKKFDLNLQVQRVGFIPGENKSTKGEQDNYSSGKC